MHELAIVQSILEAVCERADGRRVRRVTVRVGALTAVVPDAMLFCWDLAAEATLADGAELDIEQRPATTRCRACGADSQIADPVLLCPCGSADVAVTGGRELQIVSMEVT